MQDRCADDALPGGALMPSQARVHEHHIIACSTSQGGRCQSDRHAVSAELALTNGDHGRAAVSVVQHACLCVHLKQRLLLDEKFRLPTPCMCSPAGTLVSSASTVLPTWHCMALSGVGSRTCGLGLLPRYIRDSGSVCYVFCRAKPGLQSMGRSTCDHSVKVLEPVHVLLRASAAGEQEIHDDVGVVP